MRIQTTKKDAIKMVQQFLDFRNSNANRHVFKEPVYQKLGKKIKAILITNYWALSQQSQHKIIEDYIEPDGWKDNPVFEIILEEYIREQRLCWSIPFASRQWVKTNNFKYGSIGGGPIFVDKENGKMYQTGSAPMDWNKSFEEFKNGSNKDDWPKWSEMNKKAYNITI